MSESSASRIEALKPRPGSRAVMVLPDAHFPNFCPKAMGAVLLAHEVLKPDEVVVLGDWLDCEAWSAHPKKALTEDRAKSFHKHEIQPVNRALNIFAEHSKKTAYLAGNHEDRVERRLCDMGSLGASIEELVSPKLLLSEGRGSRFEYISYNAEVEQPLPHYKIAEDFIAIHGWSFAKQAATKHLEIAKCYSLVHGHTHRRQLATTREPITGRVFQASSPGCLSRLQPLYLQHNPSEWSHGFDLIWVTNDRKSWTSYTVMIRDGVCVLPGGLKVDGTSNRGRQLVRMITEGK